MITATSSSSRMTWSCSPRAAIPGNRRAIGRVMNHIAHRGAEVIPEERKAVHVSGHGSAEELKLMLSLVRPRHFVPIHGEYRYLAEHARVATRVTGGRTTVLLAEDGDVIRLAPGAGRIEGRVATGRALIDGTRSGEVGDEVLRHRRHLAADGRGRARHRCQPSGGSRGRDPGCKSPAVSSWTNEPIRCSIPCPDSSQR